MYALLMLPSYQAINHWKRFPNLYSPKFHADITFWFWKVDHARTSSKLQLGFVQNTLIERDILKATKVL